MTIYRGGADLERLYLASYHDDLADLRITATNIPDVDMSALIARHVGRYGLCSLFLRPGMRMLDFPCGSGYAAEFLKRFGASYMGWDNDPYTIECARALYGHSGQFNVADLREPGLPLNTFDLIACIEGLEHIEQKYQAPLIMAFYDALKPEGVLIVSCPMSQGPSGPNPNNSFHLYELNREDFWMLMCRMNPFRMQLIELDEILSTGEKQTMMFGICRR